MSKNLHPQLQSISTLEKYRIIESCTKGIRRIVFAISFGLNKECGLFLAGTIIPLSVNTTVINIAQNYFIPIIGLHLYPSITDASSLTAVFYYYYYGLFFKLI